jgi:TusA-related sulfurtransferase
MKIQPGQYNEEIVIDRIACPMHVIALKKGLDEINDDETLKVTTGAKNVGQELTSACLSMGHQVDAIEENFKTILYVKKAGYK